MQSILRETLLAQALKLSNISHIYRTESYRFVDAYFNWLEEAEKDLSILRSPLVVLLQAEKSSLSSVLDGYLPSNIQPKQSIRKSQKAQAAQSLEKVSREIYSKIESIDNNLDQLNEKLCHAIAVLVSKEPDVLKKLQASQQGVTILREMLSRTPETIAIYNYFCAKLVSVDIDYILMDIIQKIMSNKTSAHTKDEAVEKKR
jgi:hypothetical protein